jgi:class 3 adenylate cyclase
VEAPEVRYAKSGDVSVAYAVMGDGPIDIVFVSGWVLTNFGPAWEGAPAQFYEGLASFARLILFDKRGIGMSDRASGIPDLETRMDDIRAVMDAAESKRAAIMGFSEGGPMSMLFAATYPERTAASVLYGAPVSWVEKEDYPWAPTRSELHDFLRREVSRLGTDAWMDDMLTGLAPSTAHDPQTRRWWRRWVQASASPGAVQALRLMNSEIDVRHTLPAIRVPTLVLHRVEDEDVLIEAGRYIADKVPDAELVELPGMDHGWWHEPHQITREVERYLLELYERGDWDLIESDRILATVLFTDIVDSTAKLAEFGDRRWKELLQQHHAIVRRQLTRFSGREIDTAGDGFFASFDGPARAIRCARAITSAVRPIGLELRAGLHTGECELVDGKVGGIAVHIGARVASQARPGEVLVSGTVKDLVAGAGIQFHDRGEVDLKGIPGRWPLYSVDSV